MHICSISLVLMVLEGAYRSPFSARSDGSEFKLPAGSGSKSCECSPTWDCKLVLLLASCVIRSADDEEPAKPKLPRRPLLCRRLPSSLYSVDSSGDSAAIRLQAQAVAASDAGTSPRLEDDDSEFGDPDEDEFPDTAVATGAIAAAAAVPVPARPLLTLDSGQRLVETAALLTARRGPEWFTQVATQLAGMIGEPPRRFTADGLEEVSVALHWAYNLGILCSFTVLVFIALAFSSWDKDNELLDLEEDLEESGDIVGLRALMEDESEDLRMPLRLRVFAACWLSAISGGALTARHPLQAALLSIM